MQTTDTLTHSSADRSSEILAKTQLEVAQRTDRLFAGLLFAQWIFGIGLALVVSPRAWAGTESHVHPHVWAALFLELLVIALPIGLVLARAGTTLNRHVIAVAQMLTSALLIHLTGGRIETHFHVFGSLAFLAFYRDWKVLLTATIVVALDHMLRGIYLPLSAYGVLTVSPWRWLEHAAWVLFTDAFLVYSCVHHVREMAENARREASLELANGGLQESALTLDRRVHERTLELEESNDRLRDSLDQLHRTQAQLLTASRNAGKADVATSVLHNVGNVLNSVNVSATTVREGLAASRALSLRKVNALLDAHQGDLASYLTTDETGKQLPIYLRKLGEAVKSEHLGFTHELTLLQKNIDHIKNIVSMQQKHARGTGGVAELLSIADVLDDAIRLDAMGGSQSGIELVRDYGELPPVEIDRDKLLQIVLNLVGNARHALKEVPSDRPRRLAVSIRRGRDHVEIAIADTGCGIDPAIRHNIFNFGFTTKAEGHGFGLHSAACLAKELGGSLAAHSPGRDQGAVFTLELPLLAMRQAS